MKEYIQGQNKKADRELFGLVGSLLVDPKIQELFGMAIVTLPEDLWFVSTTAKGDLRGFATGRVMKNATLHLRYVYAESKMAKKALIQRALNVAKKRDLKAVWTNDRQTETIWAEFDFVSLPRSRGSFCRWEKDIEVVK